MPFPSGTLTGASGNLDVYINEVWSPKINDFAKEKRHFSLFFIDRSDELSGGGDTIHTGNITEMAANSKANATAVTLNANTETEVNLVVNTWKEVSFAIEDGDAAKFLKSRYTQEKYARNAGYTAAMVLEDAIAALFGTFTDSVGASTTEVQDSDIRKAIGILEANTKEEIADGNFRMFFDTKVWWNQIAGNTIYQLKINTAGNDPVLNRPATKLYGVMVSLSNRIPYISGTTGRYNAIAHRDAIHWAETRLPGQMGVVRVQSNYVPQYLSTVTTADLQFGVILNRATYGVNVLSSAS